MAGVPGTATAGVQFSLIPPLTTVALTPVGPGGPDVSGPFGQPPIPGPPSSPNSEMVRPCRLASASWTCQAMSRWPPPVAALAATAGSSNWYVAVKVDPVVARADEYPPRGAVASGPGTARTSRRLTAVVRSAGLTIRCSSWSGFTPGPRCPTTFSVVDP